MQQLLLQELIVKGTLALVVHVTQVLVVVCIPDPEAGLMRDLAEALIRAQVGVPTRGPEAASTQDREVRDILVQVGEHIRDQEVEPIPVLVVVHTPVLEGLAIQGLLKEKPINGIDRRHIANESCSDEKLPLIPPGFTDGRFRG